jgi:hypothetical protein
MFVLEKATSLLFRSGLQALICSKLVALATQARIWSIRCSQRCLTCSKLGQASPVGDSPRAGATSNPQVIAPSKRWRRTWLRRAPMFTPSRVVLPSQRPPPQPPTGSALGTVLRLLGAGLDWSAPAPVPRPAPSFPWLLARINSNCPNRDHGVFPGQGWQQSCGGSGRFLR